MATIFKELERLLGTAKSKDRRNFIENAISSLDSQRIGSASSSMRAQSLIPTLHPTTHASAFSNQKAPGDGSKTSNSSKLRPMSAQRRRPSLSSLDAIPELLFFLISITLAYPHFR